MDDEFDDSAPGWDAITAAVDAVYAGQEPKHYGTVLPAFLGGNDPLQGISVYRNEDATPHYHYVTYGFSELYEKESNNEEYSGYGFELTFRLVNELQEEEPPNWPLNLLQNLGRYVFSTGNVFDERHYLPLNGPIAIGEETKINSVVIVKDPQLGDIDTPNGKLAFLQLVGLTQDEFDLLKDGYLSEVVERVMALHRYGATDIYRDSILKDPSMEAAIREKPAECNQSQLLGTIVEWSCESGRAECRIGATLIDDLKRLLRKRTLAGLPLGVFGKEHVIDIKSGDENSVRVEDSFLHLTLTPEMTAKIEAGIEPKGGQYAWQEFPDLSIEVVPVDIKDDKGIVVRRVG